MDEIIESLDALPPVPDVIAQLQEMFYMDAYNAADVESVIKRDPALVADILKIANSPLYGFVREILEIRQAIVLFGLDQVIEFALASFIEHLQPDLRFYGINIETFLKIAHQKSEVAKELVKDKKERFLVANTAFLSDVSKIIIAPYATKRGIAIDADNLALNALDEVEKDALGFDTIEVSAKMFEHWHFDVAMVELLKNFKEQKNLKQRALFATREVVTIQAALDEDRLNLYKEQL